MIERRYAENAYHFADSEERVDEWGQGRTFGEHKQHADQHQIVLPVPYSAGSVQQVSHELLHDAAPDAIPSSQQVREITRTLLSARGPAASNAQQPHVVILHAECADLLGHLQMNIAADPLR